MEEEKVGKVKSNNDGERRADWFKLHLPEVSLRQDWKTDGLLNVMQTDDVM